jgi:hypothetical protein
MSASTASEIPVNVSLMSDDDMLAQLTGTDLDNYLTAMEAAAQAAYNSLAANYTVVDGRFAYTQLIVTADEAWPSA